MEKYEIFSSTLEYLEHKLKQSDEGGLLLDEIADKIGYSKFYLNRLFQEYTHVTIHQYIMERRLTIAAEKLARTDKPISEIGYEAGYQSQQAFANAFSSIYLCSPSRYRLQGIWTPLRSPHMRSGLCLGVAA